MDILNQSLTSATIGILYEYLNQGVFIQGRCYMQINEVVCLLLPSKPEWGAYLASSSLGYFEWFERSPYRTVIGTFSSTYDSRREVVEVVDWELSLKRTEGNLSLPGWVVWESVSRGGQLSYHESEPWLCKKEGHFVCSSRELEEPYEDWIVPVEGI